MPRPTDSATPVTERPLVIRLDWAVAGTVLVCIAGWIGLRPSETPVEPISPKVTAAVPATAAAAGTAATAAASGSTPLVGPWSDGQPDGALALDASRHLVIDLALRRRFDWLLSAVPKLGPDVLRARLAEDARSARFPESEQQALIALFDRYVGYIEATGPLASDRPGSDRRPAELAAVLERRRVLRREKLGLAAAEAFFAADEARDAWLLERMTLAHDASLDPATRAARLAELAHRAPPALREVEEDRAALEILSAAANLSDPAQRQALRERAVGPEAAARLAAVDAEDAMWKQRLEAAAREQATINAAGLAAGDRLRELSAMVERRFSGTEQVRARALLGIDPVP